MFLGLGFLVGCLLLHSGLVLPPWHDLLAAMCCAALLLWKKQYLIGGVFAGFVWAGLMAIAFAPALISPLPKGHTFDAELTVGSLPQGEPGQWRFIADVHQLDQQAGDWRLRVSWRRPQPPQVGERWRLPLRIRPASSYHNPGSWDYTGWLYQSGIVYTAYVTRGERERLGQRECCWLNQLREAVRGHLQALIPPGRGRAFVLALVLGDRGELQATEKAVLQQTGAAHLVAISGLHVGLVAGFFGALSGFVWRRIPRLCRRTPALLAGSVVGLLVATGYALLSGFGLPVQRALVMLAIAVIAIVLRRQHQPWQVFGAALIAVLLFDPLAPQSAGFWLSFVAVAAILLTLQRFAKSPAWQQAIVLQLAISLSLYPVLLAFDMPVAALSAPINLILVPLFGVLLLPVTLLLVVGTGLSVMLAPLLVGMAEVYELLLDLLTQIALIAPQPSALAWDLARWLLLLVATVWLLLPRWPAKAAALLLWLSAHAPMASDLKAGELELWLWDVGQGLSVFARTAEHNLLYDTGAAYPSGFSLAERVVLPALRYLGVAQLDRLVLSHADNDHAGGAPLLLDKLPVAQVFAGEPEGDAQQLCDGQRWHWDGIDFAFAPNAGYASGNNASCVLRIRIDGEDVIIPGDIEKTAERRYLKWLAESERVSVMIAPHHGSRTSSSPDWVAASRPQYVLFAVGQGNRWGFPKPDVVGRWREAGAQTHDTASAGALLMRWTYADDASLGSASAPEEAPAPAVVPQLSIKSWRASNERHWHRLPLNSLGE